MRKNTASIIFLFVLVFKISSQNIIPINLQGQTNRFVFDSIKNKLDKKRIICLGESEHMVETFSSCKTELIKYLHEKMGYEVVAFEVGLLNISNAYYNIQSDTIAVKSGLYSIWQTESLLNLYGYVEDQKKSQFPLILSGFDIKSNTSASGIAWIASLFATANPTYSEVIFKTDTAIINACEKVRKSYFTFGYNNFKPLSKDELKKFSSFYSSLSDSLIIRKDYFISNHLLNELQYRIILHAVVDRIRNVQFFSMKDFDAANNYRDSIMSENIRWLIKDLYPDKKIILWGHDAHLAKKSLIEDKHTDISSIEILPNEIKEYIQTISLNFVGRAPKKIQKRIKQMEGNAFFIENPNYLNGTFEDVIYFKNTESIDAYKLK